MGGTGASKVKLSAEPVTDMVDNQPPLVGLVSDILKVPDVLFVVKSGAAVAEIRGDLLDIHYRNDWITVGDNSGPAHMHINMTGVSSARFVRETKPKRTSYSVQLVDDSGGRILAAFFTKMYDSEMNLRPDRVRTYESLEEEWGDKI